MMPSFIFSDVVSAAGANDIDTETFVKWLCKYYNGIDYVNSKEYKKKEKKAAKKSKKNK